MDHAARNMQAESKNPKRQDDYKNRPKHKSSFLASCRERENNATEPDSRAREHSRTKATLKPSPDPLRL
jgi:chromatin remodeling complex protein RSC6